MRLGFASAEQPAHIRMTTRRHFPTPPLPSSPSLKEALPPLIRESEAPLTSCAPYQARSPLRACQSFPNSWLITTRSATASSMKESSRSGHSIDPDHW
jgi:hypothetical protein